MSVKVDKAFHDKRPEAFHCLHAVYHERDFRVRVNDPTINFVRRILFQEVKEELKKDKDDLDTCPACAAGYYYSYLQPEEEDR